ncbi:MAG: hypothetical protein B7Y26_06955 [Hydrogenophilales bacterium 16-64-46]|nr:MAG: hypothetical protein B7Z32_07610 [Hydrogenophilales bacterium 12-64-13]OYZ05503.1 MAG: hypothetical protein B7Y26_06955 [Hydrogenophilales bacterium 16-64-46]OZA40083.1 MAG: hypothetical protein B7X87_00340 [Hydrogenophilales bacterium 17-64-34]HQT00953.1 DUF4124 domain-containing protein [Thiobacillus sp.]
MKAWLIAAIVFALPSTPLLAAPLYKCIANGAVTYSDTPCRGATRQARLDSRTRSRPTPPPVVTPTPIPAPETTGALEVYVSSYNKSAVASASVDGGLIRQGWKDIETTAGVYSWQKIDDEIKKYVDAKKKFSLALIAGPSTPAFYKTGTTVSFTHRDKQQTMPVPWDTTYLGGLSKLMQEAGKRYGSHASLRLVYVPQISLNGIEGSLPATTSPSWSEVGYTSAQHANAVLEMAEVTKSAFPNTRVAVELHEVLRSTEQPKLVLAGLDPDKFGIGIWWLGQATYQTALQTEIKAWTGPKFMQAIGAAAKEPHASYGYRLTDYSGTPWGIDGIRQHTIDLGGEYIELWPVDATTYTSKIANW